MPISKESEPELSRSVMVVDVTDRDLRTLAVLMREHDLEDDLMVQSFRLKGDKFTVIINSILSVNRWNTSIKPLLVQTFGESRCRFESAELDEKFEKMKGGAER